MSTRTAQLGDVCEFIRGITFPGGEGKPEPFHDSVACITTSGVQQDVAWNSRRFVQRTRVTNPKQMLQGGDILISTANSRALVGKSCLVHRPPFPCTFGAFVTVARPQGDVHPPYLAYWMTTRTYLAWCLKQSSSTTNISNLRVSDLEELEFPLPELAEQKRIAAQLEQADRLRRIRRYALGLADAFLPAAFLELFGDPATNPLGFERVQVATLFAETRDGAKCGPFGSALKKHEYVASGIPVWTMNNVGANEFIEEGCLYITAGKYEELSAYAAQNGDILISRAGTVGRMAIVRTGQPRSIIHSNIIRLSLNHAVVLPIYFVSLMTWFAPRVAKLKRGQESAYTFMSTGSLRELQIQLPPLPLQQQFAAVVTRLERLRAVQREALREAEHLFATLLHRAFTD